MNAQTRSEVWKKVRGWVVGLTGVLVVVPSLINAGVDIYKSALSIPRTKSEQINADLLKKYFNKTALLTVPVPIMSDLETITMKLSVFDGGDTFVEYGNHAQWFPFPTQKQTSISIVSSAYAQSPTHREGTGKYTQIDKAENNKIVRARYYSDGVKESYIIDANTGNIENKAVTQQAVPSPNASKLPEVEVQRFPVFDLNALKKKIQTLRATESEARTNSPQ